MSRSAVDQLAWKLNWPTSISVTYLCVHTEKIVSHNQRRPPPKAMIHFPLFQNIFWVCKNVSNFSQQIYVSSTKFLMTLFQSPYFRKTLHVPPILMNFILPSYFFKFLPDFLRFTVTPSPLHFSIFNQSIYWFNSFSLVIWLIRLCFYIEFTAYSWLRFSLLILINM